MGEELKLGRSVLIGSESCVGVLLGSS